MNDERRRTIRSVLWKAHYGKVPSDADLEVAFGTDAVVDKKYTVGVDPGEVGGDRTSAVFIVDCVSESDFSEIEKLLTEAENAGLFIGTEKKPPGLSELYFKVIKEWSRAIDEGLANMADKHPGVHLGPFVDVARNNLLERLAKEGLLPNFEDRQGDRSREPNPNVQTKVATFEGTLKETPSKPEQCCKETKVKPPERTMPRLRFIKDAIEAATYSDFVYRYRDLVRSRRVNLADILTVTRAMGPLQDVWIYACMLDPECNVVRMPDAAHPPEGIDGVTADTLWRLFCSFLQKHSNDVSHLKAILEGQTDQNGNWNCYECVGCRFCRRANKCSNCLCVSYCNDTTRCEYCTGCVDCSDSKGLTNKSKVRDVNELGIAKHPVPFQYTA